MTRKTQISDRVTLALKLVDGTALDVKASAHCMRFIGRYSRIAAFGPLGTRLSAQLIERD
jgi:hypothetical protein